jgi:hypothetical protein
MAPATDGGAVMPLRLGTPCTQVRVSSVRAAHKSFNKSSWSSLAAAEVYRPDLKTENQSQFCLVARS